MVDLRKSYLVPFDPEDTGDAFGFMRAQVSGIDQWWLVQVWAEDDPDETVMVRFFDRDDRGRETVDVAENYDGCPWYPIPWISDEIPGEFHPSFRLSLDMPGGIRIAHEWGPEPMDASGRETITGMLEKVYEGFDHD